MCRVDFQEKDDNAFLQKAIIIINERLSDHSFDVGQFANSMNISGSTLYRRLTGFTGLSPCELIRHVRMNKARQLLANQSLYIGEIAVMLGFNSAKYFSKCFENRFGILPREFRLSLYNREMPQEQISNYEFFLNKAVSFIENNITDTYTINQLARDMKLSESTLYRRIKVITGQSLCRFMRSVKLRYARSLLEVGYGAINDIAMESGFDDVKYFTKCFRMEFGFSPKEYINQCS